MNKYLIIAVSVLLCCSCKKELVIFNPAPNENLELSLILKLNGKECFYDETNELLKYSLDQNELENFSPFTEFQTYSTIYFNGIQLKNNAINAIGTIELNKTYSVEVVTNGEKKHFQLLFTNMPLVRIVLLDEITNEPKSLAKMTINYAGINRVSTVDWIGIEQRGASSLSFGKKSYGIGIFSDKSTDNPTSRSYFELDESHNWILDAMYIDKSRCRNKVSFSLWASMGDAADHARIHSVFVEVFLNNKSIGLYCFNEDYSEKLLNLNHQSRLYKGIDNSEITFFKKLPKTAPISARWDDWEQKYPSPSMHIVWDEFKSFKTLVIEGTDNEFNQSIESVIDLNNVIDYYLFVNLIGGMDNVGKNWHFLKRSSSEKFIIVPWDLDATWGRNASGIPVNYYQLTNRLFERLRELNPEHYNQRLVNRWNELRLNQFSETNLSALFSANFTELNNYQVIDVENRLWNQSLNIAQEEIFINDWFLDRLAYLDLVFQ
jgi:hypothetical protein